MARQSADLSQRSHLVREDVADLLQNALAIGPLTAPGPEGSRMEA
jgi:hypothetical protein